MLLCASVSGAAGSAHLSHQQTPAQSTTQNTTQSSQPSQSTEGTSGTKTESTPKPKSSTSTKSGKKKKNNTQSDADSASPKKKVVTRGGTDEPTTQISPSMTEEQVAKTRASTSSLITQTDENLVKLSTRQLTADEQETVDQIRKFVEQSKAADHEGDLPRAASLANKAKLLSDALLKP